MLIKLRVVNISFHCAWEEGIFLVLQIKYKSNNFKRALCSGYKYN